MKKMDTFKKTELVTHPLEDLFDMPSGTTLITTETRIEEPNTEHVSYDEKDSEIDNQFQTIFDLALDAYNEQLNVMEDLEPSFTLKNAELANHYLQTALEAAKSKMQMKQSKDKLSKAAAKTVNNNLIMDRNDMLKLMMNGHSKQ